MRKSSLLLIGIGIGVFAVSANSGLFSMEDLEEGRKIIEDYSKRNVFGPDEVKFFLYTRDNPNRRMLAIGNLKDFRTPALQMNKTTKVIIHGFLSNSDRDWFQLLKKKYLDSGDYNVIIVDWRSKAWSAYAISAKATREVGERIGYFLARLKSELSMSLSKVHIIGYSLGAHVAGFAGSFLFRNTSEKVDRITGVDPAGPYFTMMNEYERLDSTDAIFVDVIHTCDGSFGYKGSLGDVGFYPNGGKPSQPGCSYNKGCSHLRSLRFMIESVGNPNAFMATKCVSWEKFEECLENSSSNFTFMGEFASREARGSYFLKTKGISPYSLS